MRFPALQVVKIKKEHEDSKYPEENSHSPILYYAGGCTLHCVPLHIKVMKIYHVIVIIFPQRSLTLGVLRFIFYWYFPGRRKKKILLCHPHFLDPVCVGVCVCVGVWVSACIKSTPYTYQSVAVTHKADIYLGFAEAPVGTGRQGWDGRHHGGGCAPQ